MSSVVVAEEHGALAQDYALHRLRAWRAHRRGVLHPANVSVGPRSLTLSFPTDALTEPVEALLPFERWRDDVLLPALHVLVSCLERGVVGFAPLRPLDGRWVPPVSWFLPRSPSEPHDNVVARDLTLAHAWMLDQRGRSRQPRHPADQRLFDSLASELGKGSLLGVKKLLKEDRDDAARRRRLAPAAPSFLALLTEAELLERVGNVFRYRVVARSEAEALGLPSGGRARTLEVDTKWRDPHFPPMQRPSPQELWDTLTDESKTTPVFAVFKRLPNPLRKAGSTTPRARWVGVHIDQPYLTVIPDGAGLPKSGWVMIDNAGDNTLMLRKRQFTSFAGAHPGLTDLLAEPPPLDPFEHNPQARDALEEVILGHRGVFPVQGPPGTGKTYLATQVVRRFLARNPGGRVLVCAKEHFALDHILRKIVDALQEDGLPCRPWRSVSQSRLRRARGETDTRWLAPAVTRDLAVRSWTAESAGWAEWQASTGEEHDRRLATLGQQSANLFFCTTMDAAMVGFLDTESFDLVIVEEAGKCYPSELLHAVCLGRTSLLIGDHMQLPPYQERRTREAVEAWTKTLGRAVHRQEHRADMLARFGATFQALYALADARGPLTLEEQAWIRPFEFLFDRLPARHRIEEQFRMEAPLSRVIGEVFYGKPFIHRKEELVAAGKLPARPLGEVVPDKLDVPLVWLDTPHMLDVPEATEDPAKRGVRDNRYELEVVLAYLRQLRPAEPIDMVILTPYNAQKSLMLDSAELRAVCQALTDIPFERVVRTTDEYQGREAELTVLSLVRNNSLGARAWGFMTEKERLNVMFSRTRFRQVVVGCSDHIERHAEEASWLHGVWKAYQRQARDPGCAIIRDAREVLRG